MGWRRIGAREWRLNGEAHDVQIHQIFEHYEGSILYCWWVYPPPDRGEQWKPVAYGECREWPDAKAQAEAAYQRTTADGLAGGPQKTSER